MARRVLSLSIFLLIAALALPMGSSVATAQDSLKLIEWDYWVPPSNQSDVWGQLETDCATANNLTIERQPAPRNDLITKVLLAAQQQQLPDILLIDNPDLQQVADTGALAPLTDYG